MACFNILNTTLPLIVLGVLDHHEFKKEVKVEKYLKGVQSFSFKQIAEYSCLAIGQGTVLTFCVVNFCKLNVITSFGKTENLDELGTVLYICVVIAVLLEI